MFHMDFDDLLYASSSQNLFHFESFFSLKVQ